MLGLDGAGFDVVSDLCARGVTPNLAALARGGTTGPLTSTVPPITGPSWLGLVTGLGPPQTGIADFLVRTPPGFELRPIGSRDFRGRALWDVLGAAGARVAVFNFPILYPPYAVNGVMVSGFGTDESTQWTSPPELKAEILAAVGGEYNLTINYHHPVYDDAHRLLDDLGVALERRLRAAELVARREPWDLFALVLSETDWLLHRCWADLDASHPRHDPDRSPAIAERALDVWRRVDAAIPRLLDALGPDASILVCSDHGFGPNTRTVKINLALESAGLLVRRPAGSRRGASLRRAGARAAQRAGAAAARVGGPLGRALSRARRRARRYLPRDESAYLFSILDFERSAAFDPGHTIPFGGLYVTSGAERGGAVYLATIDRVEEALDELGRRSGVNFTTRRSWLDAPGRPETLPDLVVSGDDWASTFLKTEFEGPPVLDGPYSPRHTGSHRMEGMYLFAGPLFAERAPGRPADILDVTPTLLAAFGIAAPPDRTGRILDVLASPPQSLIPAITSMDSGGGPSDDHADADVRERLRGLGYIE
jgi:predicted AlkP superfamily phosphohydrolase/phosphomutase